MEEIVYPAKVLLFGEYTVLNGGSALAIPLRQYGGHWSRKTSRLDLMDFFHFLMDFKECKEEELGLAIKEHWSFESNIPLGYGIGSSGALTAAAYDRFFEKNALSNTQLKEILSKIESYFHGISSGIDPLTSFLNCPIVAKDNVVTVYEDLPIKDKLFLYDSGFKRNSKPLIQKYKNKLQSSDDFQDVVFGLSRFTERVIGELIRGEAFDKSFKEISTIQLENFKEMIPENITKIWQAGLESNSYYMKLSGAGGGGYFLVYKNSEAVGLDLIQLS